jgi:hypothetical protein
MSAVQKTPKHPEPADLILYLPLYNVVVCSTCKYAIQPQAIARHLKETHHIKRSYRRPFMQYISKLSLNDAETVIRPKIHEFRCLYCQFMMALYVRVKDVGIYV